MEQVRLDGTLARPCSRHPSVHRSMPLDDAAPPIVLGCSTLGLPPLQEDDYVEYAMEQLFEKAPYRQIEIHLDERLADRAGERRLFTREVVARFERISRAAQAHGATSMLGFGGRYLLSDRKHRPTLFEEDEAARRLKVRMLSEGVETAADVGATAVIFLAGPSPLALANDKYETAEWSRFLRSMEELLAVAERVKVTLAPEAHGQHLFSRIADLRRLRDLFGSPLLGFTGDTVHQALVERDRSLRDVYREIAPIITHVQVDYAARLPRSGDEPIEKTSLFDAPMGAQRLADLLARDRVLDQQRLASLGVADELDGEDLARRLVEEGLCSRADVDLALRQQQGIGVVDIDGAFRGLVEGGYRGALAVESFVRDVPEVDPLEYARAVGRYMAARYRLPTRSPARPTAPR